MRLAVSHRQNANSSTMIGSRIMVDRAFQIMARNVVSVKPDDKTPMIAAVRSGCSALRRSKGRFAPIRRPRLVFTAGNSAASLRPFSKKANGLRRSFK